MRGRVAGMLFLLMVLHAHLAAAAEKGFSVRLGLAVDYDDNIFEYSEIDLQLFDPALEKYRGLSSTDDWIVVPSVALEYRTPFTYPTTFYLEAKPKFYTSNDVKNYQVFTGRLSQELPANWEVGLRYQLVPSYFYKRLADPPNQAHSYADATFGIDTLKAYVSKDVGDWFSGTLTAGFGTKDYNDEFNERDITIVGGIAEASFRPWKSFRLTLEGGCEAGRAEGWDDPAFNSDTSYDQWSAGASVSQRLTTWLTLGGGYSYEYEKYITKLVHDWGHYQRVDMTQTIDAYLRFRILKQLSLRAGFELTDCNAEKAGAEMPYNTFSERRYTVSTSYEF